MRKIVVVLDTDNIREGATFFDLLACHIAEADMPDQPLALQFRERYERRLDAALGRPVSAEHQAQVDDVKRIHFQVSKIVMHGTRQVFR